MRAMKRTGARWLALATCLVLALGVGSLQAVPKPKLPAPSAVLARLGWLAGIWRQEKGGKLTDESWLPPAGGVMLGMIRTVAKGRLVDYGYRQIREGPGGELFYVLQPPGQPEAAYLVGSLTDTEAVFENTEHDYPRKITYTLQGDGLLLAVFEGTGPEGETKVTEFSYRRISTPSEP